MDLECFEAMYRYYVTVSAGKNNIMSLIMIILYGVAYSGLECIYGVTLSWKISLTASLMTLPTELRGQVGSSEWCFGSQSSSFDISLFLFLWPWLFYGVVYSGVECIGRNIMALETISAIWPAFTTFINAIN